MIQKRRHCYGAARFCDGLRVLAESFERASNVILCDPDNSVDIFSYVLKIMGADALRAKAIGERLCNLLGRERDDVACLKAGLGIARQFGFHAEDFNAGFTQLERGRHSADQSTASDRN